LGQAELALVGAKSRRWVGLYGRMCPGCEDPQRAAITLGKATRIAGGPMLLSDTSPRQREAKRESSGQMADRSAKTYRQGRD